MKRFHFTNGLLISTLALGAAACSSDTATTTGGGKDGGGGASSSTGGATGSTGGGGSKTTGGSTGSTGGSKSTGGSTGSTGGGKSTGGATGSTGGSKSTGGAGTQGDGGDPDGAAGPSAACESYCTANLAACTGDVNRRYNNRDACLTACASFATTGQPGATTGNTLQCRVYHTTAAANGNAADKTTHCPHTGPQPTAFCI